MKKTIIIFIFLLVPLFGISQIKLGPKLSYGSDISSVGIGAKGKFYINETFAISADANYFFGDSDRYYGIYIYDDDYYDFDRNLITLNGDLHYIFNFFEVPDFEFYALGGLNVALLTYDYGGYYDDSGLDYDDSDTNLGINIGGGAAYSITERIDAFAEIKYVISDFSQAVLGIGVLFSL